MKTTLISVRFPSESTQLHHDSSLSFLCSGKAGFYDLVYSASDDVGTTNATVLVHVIDTIAPVRLYMRELLAILTLICRE